MHYISCCHKLAHPIRARVATLTGYVNDGPRNVSISCTIPYPKRVWLVAYWNHGRDENGAISLYWPRPIPYLVIHSRHKKMLRRSLLNDCGIVFVQNHPASGIIAICNPARRSLQGRREMFTVRRQRIFAFILQHCKNADSPPCLVVLEGCLLPDKLQALRCC
jgi:hypothetical protein